MWKSKKKQDYKNLLRSRLNITTIKVNNFDTKKNKKGIGKENIRIKTRIWRLQAVSSATGLPPLPVHRLTSSFADQNIRNCVWCYYCFLFVCLSSDLKFCRSEHQILCMLTSLQCMCDVLGFVRSVAHQRGPNLSLSKCQIVTLGGEDPLRLILKGKGLRLTWYLSNLFVVQSGRKCINIIITAILILDILVIITTNIKAKGMCLK